MSGMRMDMQSEWYVVVVPMPCLSQLYIYTSQTLWYAAAAICSAVVHVVIPCITYMHGATYIGMYCEYAVLIYVIQTDTNNFVLLSRELTCIVIVCGVREMNFHALGNWRSGQMMYCRFRHFWKQATLRQNEQLVMWDTQWVSANSV